jgi:hypothetical protein
MTDLSQTEVIMQSQVEEFSPSQFNTNTKSISQRIEET